MELWHYVINISPKDSIWFVRGLSTQTFRRYVANICFDCIPFAWGSYQTYRIYRGIPTMHYRGISRLRQSIMIAYKVLTEFLWNSGQEMHCGNVTNTSYCPNMHLWLFTNLAQILAELPGCSEQSFFWSWMGREDNGWSHCFWWSAV